MKSTRWWSENNTKTQNKDKDKHEHTNSNPLWWMPPRMKSMRWWLGGFLSPWAQFSQQVHSFQGKSPRSVRNQIQLFNLGRFSLFNENYDQTCLITGLATWILNGGYTSLYFEVTLKENWQLKISLISVWQARASLVATWISTCVHSHRLHHILATQVTCQVCLSNQPFWST